MSDPSSDADELSIAQPEDFFVIRDADDEIQPVTQALPGVEEQIRIVPITIGDMNEYGGTDGQLNPAELNAETIATILNEHWYDVRTNDELEITAEMVDGDMIGYGRDALVQAILRASGYDMQNALNMENLEVLDRIDDPEKLETLAGIRQHR
jgi:hypothetical protein